MPIELNLVKEYWISHPPFFDTQAKPPSKWMKGTDLSPHSIVKTLFLIVPALVQSIQNLLWLLEASEMSKTIKKRDFPATRSSPPSRTCILPCDQEQFWESTVVVAPGNNHQVTAGTKALGVTVLWQNWFWGSRKLSKPAFKRDEGNVWGLCKYEHTRSAVCCNFSLPWEAWLVLVIHGTRAILTHHVFATVLFTRTV